ncbi:zinc-ribbon domain-containing protein [Parvularcula sp. LCG005]|uniref:zinc-ribbon domain-containing protein n=1 Tax=Parvularcula sp. LCG005 TaxID=3078805 RepID=UPI0029422930|nr:zinc-ribbon domain-containing protein [Parvularcula sp. LCG005]WOI53644.1 zinc-ribbon domain-containing protein [Parvularcula sp. LCG005]
MMISCPSCPKTYRVAASAIPPEGRDVHCASCGAVWFERGVVADTLDIEREEQMARHLAQRAEVELAEQILSALAPRQGVQAALATSEASIGDATSKADDQSAATEASETAQPAAPREQEGSRTALAIEDKRSVSAPVPSSKAITIDMPRTPASAEQRSAIELVQYALKRRWRIGRRRRPSQRDIPPGQAAAERFRAQIRARNLNRMTPLRAIGWSAWAATIVVTLGVLTQFREPVQSVWPRLSNAYALFEPTPVSPVRLSDVKARYAQSTHGPVLELRGTLINEGKEDILPELKLASLDNGRTFSSPVRVSSVPIPRGGERPFVIRAQVPAGTRQASLSIASTTNATGERSQFVLQQTGSGWGEALPDAAIRQSGN